MDLKTMITEQMKLITTKSLELKHKMDNAKSQYSKLYWRKKLVKNNKNVEQLVRAMGNINKKENDASPNPN